MTGTRNIKTLKDLRERLLGYSLKGAARLSGLAQERIEELEADRGLGASVWELEALARIYGVDADLLSEDEVTIAPNDAVAALASSDELREVGDDTRRRVVDAARAVRDLRWLQTRLHDRAAPGIDVPQTTLTAGRAPYRQGAQAAQKIRSKFAMGDQPIASVRDWVRDCLPAVSVLYARLGSEGPAGLSFAGPAFGAAVVLNLDGKNANPCVRRFSLAHDLAHLFIDWNRHEPLAQLSGFMSDSQREREQRANAFAVRFLCPESALRRLPEDDIEAARALVHQYGLNYAAARLYLRNEREAHALPSVPPASLVATSTENQWETAEAPHGLATFPVEAVPELRRTAVASQAARAYSLGLIQRDRFAALLDVTPTENLELVLDFFALDVPEDSAAA